MKALFLSACLLGLGLSQGCVSHPDVVLDPVGPAVLKGPSAAEGSLVVFSAFDSRVPSGNEPDYRRHYTAYSIYTKEGELLRGVANRGGPNGDEPATQFLPPGNYRIVAAANGFPKVTVPVVVEAQRQTVIHLEGGGWGGRSTIPAESAVRLPDGRVVGWRSEAPVAP